VVRENRVKSGGAYAAIAAISGTFALNGPEMCSGLPVARYDAETLGRTLGAGFALIETRPFCHRMPMGRTQVSRDNQDERAASIRMRICLG